MGYLKDLLLTPANPVRETIDAAGRVIYVGITYADRFASRVAEHGSRFAGGVKDLVTVTSRDVAHGVEQVLIERLPNLENIYNSIAKNNPMYDEMTRRGLDVLNGIGYRFPNQ